MSSCKKKGVQTLKEATHINPNNVKTKTISIGWRHRFYSDKPYAQIKKEKGGGKFPLLLQMNRKYTIDDLIREGKKLFTSDRAKSLFPISYFELGFFKGVGLKDLSYPMNRNNDDLIEYLDYYKNSTTRTNLYLLTTIKPEYATFDELDEDEMSILDEETNSAIEENNNEDVLSELSINKVPVKRKSDVEKDTKKLKSSNNEEKENSEMSGTFNTNNNQSDSSINYNSGVNLNQVKILSQSNKKVNEHDFYKNEKDVKILDNTFNIVRVYYLTKQVSRYSKELIVTEDTKFDILNTLRGTDSDYVIENPQSHDPIDFGFQISTIEVNEKPLYKVVFDTEKNVMKYMFTYPTAPKDHTLLYDIDVVHGYADGFFGLGIVPKGTSDCTPLCSWYCNGALFKQGLLLFWLSSIPSSQVESTWQCNIKCIKGCNVT